MKSYELADTQPDLTYKNDTFAWFNLLACPSVVPLAGQGPSSVLYLAHHILVIVTTAIERFLELAWKGTSEWCRLRRWWLEWASVPPAAAAPYVTLGL